MRETACRAPPLAKPMRRPISSCVMPLFSTALRNLARIAEIDSGFVLLEDIREVYAYVALESIGRGSPSGGKAGCVMPIPHGFEFWVSQDLKYLMGRNNNRNACSDRPFFLAD